MVEKKRKNNIDIQKGQVLPKNIFKNSIKVFLNDVDFKVSGSKFTKFLLKNSYDFRNFHLLLQFVWFLKIVHFKSMIFRTVMTNVY
jgi:hypothetical protein